MIIGWGGRVDRKGVLVRVHREGVLVFSTSTGMIIGWGGKGWGRESTSEGCVNVRDRKSVLVFISDCVIVLTGGVSIMSHCRVKWVC